MVVSKKPNILEYQLIIRGIGVKQIEKFSYLGSLITSDGKCDSEIKKKIGLSKSMFEKMKKILRNRQLSMKTRLKVLHCYVFSTLTYGSECWTMSKTMDQRIQSAGM